MKPTWLEVYYKNGEWKVANGRTGQILRSEGTKANAVQTARSHLGTGGKYNYIGFQSYHRDGRRDNQVVDISATKSWVRSKASGSR